MQPGDRAHLGLDVARDRHVDDHQRPVRALRHGGTGTLGADHDVRRGGRADDEIGDCQRLLDVALLHDLAADFVDDRLGRDRASTGDQQARDAA